MNKKNIESLFAEAVTLHREGKLEEALRKYVSLINFDPAQSETLFMMGILYYQTNKIKDSITCLTKAVEQNPHNERYHISLGKSYLAQNENKKAEECFYAGIKFNPVYTAAYINLARLYKKENRLTEAVDFYKKALELEPLSVSANNNLGNIYQSLKRTNEAVKCFENVIKVNPIQPEPHLNLAHILSKGGFTERAAEEYKIALKLDPNLIGAEYELIRIRMNNCDWENRERDIFRLKELIVKQSATSIEIPMLNLSYSQIPLEIHKTAAEINSKISVQLVMGLRKKLDFNFDNRKKSKKINIGYISPDFREHAVGILIHDLFRHHDRNKFEIFTYSLSHKSMHDKFTENISRGSDHFRDISDLSFENAALQIYNDRIDILIDLAGHTENNMNEIISLQPAPIQVSYLGYPDTSGSENIQYILTDDTIITNEIAEHYSENVIYLPQTFIASPLKESDKKITRSDYGILDEAFVYCCFNNIAKIEPDVFKSWMNILNRTPNSILWLPEGNQTAKQNLLNEANKNGIDTDRIFFAPKLPLDEYLVRNKLADLFLDTFYYNAGTTSVCSLISALPVLTLPGQSFASRMGASILKSTGMDELICTCVDEYENKAVKLANEKNKLSEIKLKLNSNIPSSSLSDLSAFVLNLEKAFTQIWEIYSGGKKPHSFKIDP